MFVREHYQVAYFIPLHAPIFSGRERKYLVDTIDPTFVSSVGAEVDRFELEMASYTGSPPQRSTMNGKAALQIALKLPADQQDDLVITQPLTKAELMEAHVANLACSKLPQ
jgi:dTDP-4-amino-4,6-dideoxygalactose transaminase